MLVIGRQSGGEECDRHLEDDYYLTPSEKALAAQVCGAFPRVAVILNINGLIDLSWLEEYPGIQSAVFLGVPGEEGPGRWPISCAGRYRLPESCPLPLRGTMRSTLQPWIFPGIRSILKRF